MMASRNQKKFQKISNSSFGHKNKFFDILFRFWVFFGFEDGGCDNFP